MTEDPGKYVDVEVTAVESTEAPPTVTIIVQRLKRRWHLRCCPPDTMDAPEWQASAETLSEALAELAEVVEEWEQEQDDLDDYGDDD